MNERVRMAEKRCVLKEEKEKPRKWEWDKERREIREDISKVKYEHEKDG